MGNALSQWGVFSSPTINVATSQANDTTSEVDESKMTFAELNKVEPAVPQTVKERCGSISSIVNKEVLNVRIWNRNYGGGSVTSYIRISSKKEDDSYVYICGEMYKQTSIISMEVFQPIDETLPVMGFNLNYHGIFSDSKRFGALDILDINDPKYFEINDGFLNSLSERLKRIEI
jgi:hypothetical protein